MSTPATANPIARKFLSRFEPSAIPVNMSRSWLKDRNIEPTSAALFTVNGDSMTGTIEHGDMVLVNTADTQPRESRVYLVLIDESYLLVKRVQRIPRGINLLSDNPRYEPITIMDGEATVSIVGRVAAAFRVLEMLP